MQNSFLRIVSRLLVICMFAMPFSSHAGMISTEQVAAAAQQQASRDTVLNFMTRGDVQAQMQTLGVDAGSAKDRVAAMTDAEVQQMASKIESAPAGAASNGWAVAVGLAVIVWVVYYMYYR